MCSTKDFNYLLHVSVEITQKMQKFLYVSIIKFSIARVKAAVTSPASLLQFINKCVAKDISRNITIYCHYVYLLFLNTRVSIGSDNAAYSVLNQCWVVVNWTLRNKFQWNLNQNTKLLIHKNASENIVCEMAAILSRGRWVKSYIALTFLLL